MATDDAHPSTESDRATRSDSPPKIETEADADAEVEVGVRNRVGEWPDSASIGRVEHACLGVFALATAGIVASIHDVVSTTMAVTAGIAGVLVVLIGVAAVVLATAETEPSEEGYDWSTEDRDPVRDRL